MASRQELPKQADNIFEEFPMKQRRHYTDHPSKRDAIGSGLNLVGDEVRQFTTMTRQENMGKSTVVLGTQKAAPAPTMAQSDDPHFLSSYQMQCRGSDDVGTIKKQRGKKMIQPPFASTNRSGLVANPFQEATVRSVLPAEHSSADVGSLKQAAGHVPGYSGHVPRSGDHQASTHNIMTDKTLLTQNYRSHMTGYTGHKR